MHRAPFISLAATARSNSAAALIALGLALLVATSIFPKLLLATAFALIALGASISVCNRVRHVGWPREYLVAHLVTYVALYLLLVASTLDAASRAAAFGLSTAQVLDLGLSAIVMANATQTCVAALSRS